MPLSALQGNFTSGELSSSLSARVELEKYQRGCRTLKNFMVQPHGGATKRPGFELLDELPGQAVLVPFVFNQRQAYCLCFGEGWLRVATHDGFVLTAEDVPYQIASPYTLAQARELSFAQSADVLFLACHGVRPHRLNRLDHAQWTFEEMLFTAPLPAPQWESLSGTNYSYSLAYSSGQAYRRVEDPPNPDYFNPINENLYRQTASSYSYPYVRFVNGARDSTGATSPAQLVTPYTYYVTALNTEGKESELSEGADITGPSSNNWQGGDYIQLSWAAVDGAEEYRVYKAEFGGRAGYIATIGDTSYRDFNTAPSISEGAPKYVDPFPDDDYPGAVTLFEQRLVFASSPNRPLTVWMSKSGDYGNFAVYTPLVADSPLDLTLAGDQVSIANWLVTLRSLIIGTEILEWEISGQGEAGFSATNKKATKQSYWGSSLKRAIVVGNVILHVSSSGSQVRSLQYEFAADSYNGMDLSIMAAHLLETERIVSWAYQKNPDSIIWGVRSDGVLLGLTFQAEHQIAAWHRHDTQGKFIEVCSIPHGFEYSLFAVVERDGVYYLERMAERYKGDDASGAVFLDSSLTYRGSATKVITGLEHLEGKKVGILADGAVHVPQVVEDGRIELDHAASVVTVGLQYTADLETMPVEIVGGNGTSVSLKKHINAVNIIFHESLSVKVGLSFDEGNMKEVKWRTTEPFGKPPAPFSGMKQVIMQGLSDNVVTVCLRSSLPTPVTVLALVSRIEVNG